VKEVVVVSGKGGTGKTSIAASFAALCPEKVLADCDVDAADLHLVLAPEVLRSTAFVGGQSASIDPSLCTRCGRCLEVCRYGAVRAPGEGDPFEIDGFGCEGCSVCAYVCPTGAASMHDCVNGRWFVSRTRHGTLVHARLGVAEENSGKLATLVRREARRIAEAEGAPVVLVDGPPGIGCPVIASLTGATAALIVTEPTLSGLHDLKRIAEVAEGLGVPQAVCINKWDLNLEGSHGIEEWCHEKGIPIGGLIPYDTGVTAAQVRGAAVVECSDGAAATAVSELWDRVAGMYGL